MEAKTAKTSPPTPWPIQDLPRGPVRIVVDGKEIRPSKAMRIAAAKAVREWMEGLSAGAKRKLARPAAQKAAAQHGKNKPKRAAHGGR
jgi:hypothetical protein